MQWLAGHGVVAAPRVVQPAPEAFRKRYGEGWTQRCFGPTGHFRKVWGQGIEVGASAMSDDAQARKIAMEFWKTNESWLPSGMRIEDLQPLVNQTAAEIRFVSHRQTMQGYPVLGTRFFIAIKHGRLVMAQASGFPVGDVPERNVSENQAHAVALQWLADKGLSVKVSGESERALLPWIENDSIDYRLVYVVPLKGKNWGKWTAYVDASKIELVGIRDERLFDDYRIEAKYHDRNPAGSWITSPVPNLYVRSSDGNHYTDEEGVISFSSSSTDMSMEMTGRYSEVLNSVGDEYEWSFNAATPAEPWYSKRRKNTI